MSEAPDDPTNEICRRLNAQSGWTNPYNDLDTDELRAIADLVDAMRWAVSNHTIKLIERGEAKGAANE